MKVLYLTAPWCDYLADSVLHGLRSLLGADVVDFPRCDVLYRDTGTKLKPRIHGQGFTCYGLLDEIPVDRYDIEAKVRAGFYDLVVISSIHRQFGWFVQLRPWLRPDRTIILDGEDHGAIYPYRGTFWHVPGHRLLLPRAHKRYLYFKREWTPETVRYLWYKMIPESVAAHLPAPRNLRTVAFSIPAEKIVSEPPAKTKEFPRHVVDPEVAAQVPGVGTGHVFRCEAEYYADLRASRWGITTKRAGWDCIRHYEIAANGAVPAFRGLDRKPSTCAPHGLGPGNSISYRDWDDLRSKTERIDDARYEELQAGAIAWARRNTTVERAKEILDEFKRWVA
jgi:hypothetical protein